MSDSTPLRLNGAKFKRDKTGLITVNEPWEVYSIEDCALWVPSSFPFGLPIVDRSAEELEVGTWGLNLTYEGISRQAPPDNNSDAFEVELDTSMAQDPIKSHPNFDVLKTKYGWDTAKEEFSETMPDTSAGNNGNALSGSNSKGKRNPLHGVESYLVVGAVFRVTFSTQDAPNDTLDGIGTVISQPPYWQYLRIPLPKGRNWLKLAPRITVRGNAARISMEWMLSGPYGWIKDVYGAAQLARGAREVGLTTGSL